MLFGDFYLVNFNLKGHEMQDVFFIVANVIFLLLMIYFFKKYYPQFKNFNNIASKFLFGSVVLLTILRLLPQTAVFASLVPLVVFLGLMIYLLILVYKTEGLKSLFKALFNCLLFFILANWMIGYISVFLISVISNI